MPKVSEQYKEEKRNSILESALRCFGEKGYQETIIDDIVQDSGISKGAIYNYFSSKEEIYLQLLQKSTDDFFEETEQQFAHLPSALDKVHYLFERFRNQALTEEHKQSMRVYLEFWLYSARQNDLREVLIKRYERFINHIAKIVEEGQQKNEFKEQIDAKEISQIFWAFRDGNVLHHSFLGNEDEYRKSVETIKQFFLNYVCK